MGRRWGRHRKATVLVGVAVLLIVIVAALVMELGVASSKQQFVGETAPLRTLSEFSTDAEKINAVLKGSIYETGGNMTVFGACLDGDGYLVPDATTGFTAWYPNGTVFVENQSMLPILNGSGNISGRWRIHLTMPPTIGTYLTQMRCDYEGDYALAFSEWQNPEWVDRLVETYNVIIQMNGSITNISQALTQLSGDVQANFSSVLSAIAALNVSSSGYSEDLWRKLLEIYNLKYAVWVVDDQNPYFEPWGGNITWYAVDVVASDRVYAAGFGGEIGSWDGVTWSIQTVQNVTWRGVSGYEAVLDYVWTAGNLGTITFVDLYFDNTSADAARYAVNGQIERINDAWYNASPVGYFADVAVFHDPNDPAASVAMLLLSDGRIAISSDLGVTWAEVDLNATGGGRGRFSNVVANVEPGTGYRVAAVTANGGFYYYDGAWALTQYPNVTFVDVVLVHGGDGYVVGRNATNATVVWDVVNGSMGGVAFTTTGDVAPAGIMAFGQEDVWVATYDPSVYYHYDGFAWEYQVFKTSDNGSVTIGFVPLNVTGLLDVGGAGQSAYAVGGDGLIMKLLTTAGMADYSGLLQNLTYQLAVINGNVVALNQTVTVNFDAVLGNLTLMQVALNDILLRLGIIEQNVNATLVIVNATQQNVSKLVEYAERPKAWTTV